MSQFPVLPLVLPLLAGALLLVLDRRGPGRLGPVLGFLSTVAQLLVALWLLTQVSTGTVLAYLAGNWPAPFGIALAVDRLSALMLVLVAVVALPALVANLAGPATQQDGRFHALFQFQLLGLNGAFLTADIFNLFVFFEVLLIASYGLLVHGGAEMRVRAGLHYVITNLAGSALLLLAVALLYGITGTLNMADLARRLPGLDPAAATLVRSAGFLLLVVFGLKAALLPLHAWLPGTYSVAAPGVAALFALLTKVGIYAIARVFTVVYGGEPGSAPWLDPGPVLLPLGLAGAIGAALGALAAPTLGRKACYLVVGSAGTLLAALGLGSVDALAAALFYLVHSTLATAALLLVAALLESPPDKESRVGNVNGLPGPTVGLIFLVAALGVVGLPPLAGFVAKALLLDAAFASAWGSAFAAIILVAALINLMALARFGSDRFWRGDGLLQPVASSPLPAAIGLLLVLGGALLVAAGPAQSLARAAAGDLLAREPYIQAVLGEVPAPRLSVTALEARP